MRTKARLLQPLPEAFTTWPARTVVGDTLNERSRSARAGAAVRTSAAAIKATTAADTLRMKLSLRAGTAGRDRALRPGKEPRRRTDGRLGPLAASSAGWG